MTSPPPRVTFDLQLLTYDPQLLGCIQAEPGAECVPQRSHHGIRQDGAQIVEEESGRHEVTGITDDGWQQKEEEESGV